MFNLGEVARKRRTGRKNRKKKKTTTTGKVKPKNRKYTQLIILTLLKGKELRHSGCKKSQTRGREQDKTDKYYR